MKNQKMILVLIAVVVGGFLLYTIQNKSQTTPTEAPATEEVMQQPDGSYKIEMVGANHVMVSSETKDVREALGIKLEYLKNGEVVWSGMIEGDPAKVCRDATGCSMDGPTLAELNLAAGDTLEIVATAADGTVLARETGVSPQ